MESQPQNPEFRNNPENFHPCACRSTWLLQTGDSRLMSSALSSGKILW